MHSFEQIVANIASVMWGWPMIILLLGTHIFLSIKLRFPQLYIFKAIKLSVTKDKDSDGDVSQFGALATSLAATIGTGNIIGVATAVSLGGPGAVLWCWFTGLFGIATKYSEGLLAIKYRVKTSDGKMLGGPMYALEKGLKMKWMAVLFCLFTAVAAFGIGNTVQANAISTLLSEPGTFGPMSSGIPTYMSGLIIAFLVALVIIFGINGIAKVCGTLVPFMAIFYIIGCVTILIYNVDYLGETIRTIFRGAFSLKSATGGITGSVIMMAARFGIARGLFSNESGLGSAPIVAAAAQTKNPVRQALVSSTGTFWDTVIICAITGMVIVSSSIAYPEISREDGGMLTEKAFGMIPFVGKPILTFGILTFAFSTILGWSYYGEKAMEFLFGIRSIIFYRIVFILFVFAGSTMSLAVVWNLADIMNALMAIPNILSLLFLSGVMAKETNYYLWEGNLDEDLHEKENQQVMP